MKKKFLSLLIVSSVLLSSVAVMAEQDTTITSNTSPVTDGTDKTITSNTSPVTDGADKTITSNTSPVKEGTEPSYISFEKLTVVGFEDGKIQTKQENEETVFFNIASTTAYDEDGTVINAEDLKEGDVITVFVNSNAPALLILPPQYTASVIIRDKADFEGSVKVSTFSKTEGERAYISAEGDLVINLPEDFKENRMAKNDYVVFYTMTTRSIPPQTTPDKIYPVEATEPEVTLKPVDFTDVPKGHKYEEEIEKAVRDGWFKGVSETEFAPEGTLTRAMMVTILGRINGIAIKDACVTGFEDAPGDQYYSSYVAWANENKIVQGYEDKKFRPNQPVTKEEAMIIVDNYCKYKGIEFDEKLALSRDKVEANRGEITAVINAIANLLD